MPGCREGVALLYLSDIYAAIRQVDPNMTEPLEAIPVEDGPYNV
jgi:hypothetical protein